MLPVAPGDRLLRQGETGGYWTTVGRLGRGISVEIWLDHFSGLSSPRAWCGISSSSPKRLSQLLPLSPLADLRKRLLTRSNRDVSKEGTYRLTSPLRSDEFDVLVREHYVGDRDYLGVYFPYLWPFSRQRRIAIVREATNVIASFCSAFEIASKPPSIRTPGPWARLDPKCEEAAVRYVRRHFEGLHYHVKSREHEICGYDLHVTRRSEEMHVEVKGCAATVPRFFISRTERRAADSQRWRLAMVTNALGHRPRLQLLTGQEMVRAFSLKPVQWEGRPSLARD